MKVFIWERVDKCTNNYHRAGGVVAIAETEEEARALANQEDGCSIDPKENPTVAIDCLNPYEQKKAYVFPDAGCC